MSTIDALLAQSLLLREPHVPADVVPYDDLLDDDLLLWQHRADDTTDDSAAHSLDALCETVVSHCTPDQLADFLTDQIPQPATARILGCALHLAGIDIGARFWWQYAAGAEDAPASYCLYLQHLAHGEPHAAALWHAQTGLGYTADQDTPDAGEYVPALHSMSADSSLSTVLRVLAQLTRTLPTRRHTPAARAVIEFVASAVTGGYARHPDLEIPLPGTYFAEQLEIVIAATTSTRDHLQPPPAPPSAPSPADDLPNRLAPNEDRKHIPTKTTPQGPEHLLVQVTAANHEPTTAHTFFENAAAICWKTATATATEQDTRGNSMAYRLRRFAQRLSPTPSSFGPLRTASPSGSPPLPFHQL